MSFRDVVRKMMGKEEVIMNYFQKVLTEFISGKLSKDKKTVQLAKLFAEEPGKKIICYEAPISMLKALLEEKPSRLLAVAQAETKEQKKLAVTGKHMISFEGVLSQIQDRVFDIGVFCPETLLTEDLEQLLGDAYRLVKEGGKLIFLAQPQTNLYTDLIKHSLTKSGFGEIRFLCDGHYSVITCVKEKEEAI